MVEEEEATFGEELSECEEESISSALADLGFDDAPPKPRRSRGAAPPAPRKTGTASAARVSRGSLHDTWPGLTQKTPKRDEHQHVTVTVVIYNTVAGGVPGVEDVRAAIDDMESLYRACGWKGHLADSGADFMKSELTVNDVAKIAEKVVTQPYTPAGEAPVGGDAFPMSDGGGGSGGGEGAIVQGEPVAGGEPRKRDCLLM